jgi:hypothetical protein
MQKKITKKWLDSPMHIDINSVKPHPENYKEHPDDQLEHIVKSIEVNGIYRNIVISKDKYILAGHGVIEACKKLKIDTIPVITMPFNHDDIRAKKLVVSDNEVSNLAFPDDRKLTELLKEINEIDTDGLLGTGFDESMLANLLYVTRPKSEIQDFDHASEWVGMPEFESQRNPLKITMSFETEKDRKSFGKLLGLELTEKTKSLWYPLKERDDVLSVRFEG